MRSLNRTWWSLAILLPVLLLGLGVGAVFADDDDDDDDELRQYRITIQNLADGQPLSPPVGATHRKQINMFEVGELASPGLEAIAEDGDQGMMFNRFNGSQLVTGVFGSPPGMPPLTPFGQVVGGFTDALTRDLPARAGDRFSLATMLICTNDGFTGLDRVKLPKKGAKIFWLNGYDAGTEDNTENSGDIVDPCGVLGPVPLPDGGNENEAVDTDPPQPIRLHANIMGGGDLSVEAHRWINPVAKVTITRVEADADEFLARLSGAGEVPPVATEAMGRARFELEEDDAELEFVLRVEDIEGVTQAHIHRGLPNMNGPVVAFLFGLADPPTGSVDGRLAKGSLTVNDLLADFAGDFEGFVAALRNGELYVNVHTVANPAGEIRGQIGSSGR